MLLGVLSSTLVLGYGSSLSYEHGILFGPVVQLSPLIICVYFILLERKQMKKVVYYSNYYSIVMAIHVRVLESTITLGVEDDLSLDTSFKELILLMSQEAVTFLSLDFPPVKYST